MYSSTKSGLQRSSSSSSIPQPCRLSRVPVRNSIQKNRGKSLSRPDKLSLDRNMTRSSSNLSEQPRFSRQRSGSLVRQTLTTPLGSCGRSSKKSPLLSSVRKDTRPIVDKRWQYEQTVKVRTFVVENFCHLDYNNIKTGIPLELFIAVMDSCFKLIDKRINIIRENYVEEVPANLKRLRYPASVKPSLMKTVNTPHSWPHVIGILSWLTDIIEQIHSTVNNTSESVTLIDDCTAKLYIEWDNPKDDSGDGGNTQLENPLHELDVQLEALILTDKEDIDVLDQELENFSAGIEVYRQKRKDKMEKIERLQANIKCVNEKCDLYTNENEKLETEMKEQCAKFTMKIKKVDQELPAFLKAEEQLKVTVASQPHSFIEKQQVTQEIKDLHNTLKLKETRLTQHRELLQTYDFKSVDIKQQTEANAYQYNNIINQLQLINPEFKELHIRESGFHRNDTENEIKEALRLITEAKIKLKQTSEVSHKGIEELRRKQKQINEELTIVKRDEEKALKLEAECSITLAHKLKEDEHNKGTTLAEIDKYQNKALQLQNSKCDLTPLQKQLNELKNKKQELLTFKQDLLDRALNFFAKLELRMLNNLEAYMDIMQGVTADVVLAQEKAIVDSKARIEKLKKAREEAECENSATN